MSHNPITGDKIATKPSKAYADNYDAVFGKKDESLWDAYKQNPEGGTVKDIRERVKELRKQVAKDAAMFRRLPMEMPRCAQCGQAYELDILANEGASCPMCDVVEIDEAAQD